MRTSFHTDRLGFTVVELIVTMAIVAIMAATLGMFFSRLLTLQEREREEAYIRETLSDICGAYADALSVGESISTNANQEIIVKYRRETGGVSLETGVVTRASYLTLTTNALNMSWSLNVYSVEPDEPGAAKDQIELRNANGSVLRERVSRTLNGSAALIPLVGNLVSCTLTPLNWTRADEMKDDFYQNRSFQTTDAALAYLQVSARYEVEDDEGNRVQKTAQVGRVVRLWNW